MQSNRRPNAVSAPCSARASSRASLDSPVVSFTMEIDGGERRIEYKDVASARTVFVWEKAPKPGKNA